MLSKKTCILLCLAMFLFAAFVIDFAFLARPMDVPGSFDARWLAPDPWSGPLLLIGLIALALLVPSLINDIRRWRREARNSTEN